MNDMHNNMMHARSVRSHKLRKITITSDIDGDIHRSLIIRTTR
jgi:hypothetical protein